MLITNSDTSSLWIRYPMLVKTFKFGMIIYICVINYRIDQFIMHEDQTLFSINSLMELIVVEEIHYYLYNLLFLLLNQNYILSLEIKLSKDFLLDIKY